MSDNKKKISKKPHGNLTKEELFAIIEALEEQRKNGNKLYTMEEVFGKAKKARLQRL